MNWYTKKILSDIAVIVVCVGVALYLSGCASIPTPDECKVTRFETEEQLTQCFKDAYAEQDRIYELEDRWARQLDIWELCQAVHEASGNITYHKHSHSKMRPTSEMGEREKVRQDIQSNGCMFIWKQYERRQNR